MKRLCCIVFLAVAIAGFSTGSRAENMLSLSIGTTWPQALLSTGICSGDAALQFGWIIDRKVGFGFAGDFLWNTRSTDFQDTSGKFHTLHADKSFMFPVMAFVMIDPVPKLIVHPSAQFQIGYNSMFSVTRGYDTAGTGGTDPANRTETSHSDYYYGLIMKAIIDASYDLGENSSVFLGVMFQWAGTKTFKDDSGLFKKRDMSGIGLHGGFRVAF
jgi:hypothetical protein